MKTTTKAWINMIVFVIVLAINYISSVGLINNIDQKEMSDKYLTPITPAPFTFSIWGVIYTLIFVSLILMILNRNKENYRAIIDKVSPLFWLSSLFNIGWVVIFLYDKILLSTLFIAALTVTLVMINRIIGQNNNNRKNSLALSFGLYNGWLLIATMVNLAAYLVNIDWNRWGLSKEMWGIILLSLAFILAVLMMAWLRNAAFTLPAAWACFGIYKFIVSPTGLDNMYTLLPKVALIYMSFLIMSAIIQFKLNKWKIIPATRRNIYL